MKTSLSRRLFRAMFAIGVINVLITLAAVEFLYEDIEQIQLVEELAAERAFFEQRIDEQQVWFWNTALLRVVYMPDGADDRDLLPPFQGLGPPFKAEVEQPDGRTYLISIDRSSERPGVLYLAKDITALEQREEVAFRVMMLFAILMLMLSLLLARLGTRHIVHPLIRLTRQIGDIEPGGPMTRIDDAYHDEELARIARTLNALLVDLDAHVAREQTLVSLASHELRTPLAVILGALEVMDHRDSLTPADRRTLGRIRRAAESMLQDVDTLLRLARSEEPLHFGWLVLEDCARAVVAELEAGVPEHAGRIVFEPVQESDRGPVWADASLVRMLLRNLLHNAIRHTVKAVHIEIGPGWLSVSDEGRGLPEPIRNRLSDDGSRTTPPGAGLGLFIVRLICERLGWQIEVMRGKTGGTTFKLLFPSDGRTLSTSTSARIPLEPAS